MQGCRTAEEKMTRSAGAPGNVIAGNCGAVRGTEV